jgi:tRNA 5-methylaminomethyl-2-thiouridine biosynthesis bifunctional protein
MVTHAVADPMPEIAQKHVPELAPWFARAPGRERGHVAIIGAGIAGCATAAALMRRGWSTTLIDRNDDIALGASGNPVGILMPRVTAAPSFESRFSGTAWRFLLRTLDNIGEVGFERCGVLQLADDETDGERLKAIASAAELAGPLTHLSAQEASDFAGCHLGRSALLFPQAGCIDPRALCTALATGARRVFATDVMEVRRAGDGFELAGTYADVVVFANGLGASSFPLAHWLPLAARRGQLTLAQPSATSAHLRCVLSYGGYITPAIHNQHAIGATFDWIDDPTGVQEVVTEDHARNLAELARVAPALMAGRAAHDCEGRAALRCTTPDHLPIVGPLPDQAAYLTDYAQLRHGQHWVRYPAATYHPGMYLLTGLGARGLTEAALAAELLACHITGEPWPLDQDLVTALHPARFLVRDLKRLKG